MFQSNGKVAKKYASRRSSHCANTEKLAVKVNYLADNDVRQDVQSSKKEAPVTLDDDGTADDPSKVPVLARSMSWGNNYAWA